MRPNAIRRPEPTSPPTTPRDKGRGATANEPEPHPQAGGGFSCALHTLRANRGANHVFCGLFE
jgi:hypothetical protein